LPLTASMPTASKA